MNESVIDLAKYRIRKAKDLLTQADILYNNNKFDGSINRSYYAIFNAIKSILALLELDSSKHKGVLSYFDLYFVKTLIIDKQYSKIAHEAFDIRQDNDYEDFYEPTQDDAISQLNNARSLVAELEIKLDQIINKKIPLPGIRTDN